MTKKMRDLKVSYYDKDTNELKSVIVHGIKTANEKVEELKKLGHKQVMWVAVWG